jgi:hypothetical protein
MQQRPVAVLIANAGSCEPGVSSEQPLERRDISTLYGRRGCEGTRIIGGYDLRRILSPGKAVMAANVPAATPLPQSACQAQLDGPSDPAA